MIEDAFKAANGVRIHYRDYQPPDTRGEPVLCLHGLTRNERDFEELAPRIMGLGRRVIVPTQRGRGLSGRDPKPKRYNPMVYVGDTLKLLDRLKIKKAVFVGTSMGALMTLIAARLARRRVAAAVLNDAGPEIDPVGLERIRGFAGVAQTASSWAEAAEICRGINGPAFPGEQEAAFWMTMAGRLFREVAPGHLELDYDPAIAASATGKAPDLWWVFNALKPVPTLLIRGEISDVLMASTVEEMRRRKPDLVVANVPGVGHAPFMTEPAAWSALSEFLERTAR